MMRGVHSCTQYSVVTADHKLSIITLYHIVPYITLHSVYFQSRQHY